MVARAAVLALIVGGEVALTAIGAGADSPNPANVQTGTAVLEPSRRHHHRQRHCALTWAKNTCATRSTPEPRGVSPGFAVNWGDNQSNKLEPSIWNGTAADNAVHIPGTTCSDNGTDATGTFASGSATRTRLAPLISPRVSSRTTSIQSSAETGDHCSWPV